jgi:hypothetical protein
VCVFKLQPLAHVRRGCAPRERAETCTIILKLFSFAAINFQWLGAEEKSRVKIIGVLKVASASTYIHDGGERLLSLLKKAPISGACIFTPSLSTFPTFGAAVKALGCQVLRVTMYRPLRAELWGAQRRTTYLMSSRLEMKGAGSHLAGY